ncbi:MAG: hypothetical protein JNK82_41865 [Myxococcaceae bacterium]|nr:hypothetical protein [Myxococcaceae bacterium]
MRRPARVALLLLMSGGCATESAQHRSGELGPDDRWREDQEYQDGLAQLLQGGPGRKVAAAVTATYDVGYLTGLQEGVGQVGHDQNEAAKLGCTGGLVRLLEQLQEAAVLDLNDCDQLADPRFARDSYHGPRYSQMRLDVAQRTVDADPTAAELVFMAFELSYELGHDAAQRRGKWPESSRTSFFNGCMASPELHRAKAGRAAGVDAASFRAYCEQEAQRHMTTLYELLAKQRQRRGR